jgi:hypothetical protein
VLALIVLEDIAATKHTSNLKQELIASFYTYTFRYELIFRTGTSPEAVVTSQII